MAKATTTIKQVLRKAQAPPVGAEGNYQAEHGAWFAANHALFNRVCAFYIWGHPSP